MTDFSDYPASIVRKVRSVPGKVSAAVQNAKVGVARQVGYAGLEAQGLSNVATRGMVNAAAEMNPVGTAKAGAAALLKSKPEGFNRAAAATFERGRAALAPIVTPVFGAIDRAEKAVGDKIEKVVGHGIRGPGDVLQKGARGASSMFKSLTTKPDAPKPRFADPKNNDPGVKPGSAPAGNVPMVRAGATGKQASNGEVAPYKRYDPRAGRMVDVGGYTRKS